MDLSPTALVALVVALAPIATCGGLWGFLQVRAKTSRSSPAAIATSQAELVAAISGQTKAFVAELQNDRRELRLVIARQARSIRKLVARVEGLEQENAECLAHGRQLQAQLAEWGELLRKHGIPIPASELPGALVVLEGDRATVLRPGHKPRTARRGHLDPEPDHDA